jgi:hypothetical protein
LDAAGHSINDLRQDDFALRVDKADTEISSWMKVQDFFRHSTYTLAFKANRAVPVNRHRIEVRVKRQNAQLRYPALLAY